ncbi:uncharacterized protein ASPGLDRAFT_31846 [Aspergillus glaucus CBS 516.65]|uniref:Uncharacterized protein n=1 Tax=Aspergillus glaucus CBS 516.65 TaxID=1160497 RepID=A0A1L9VXT0_ASPGL|nr:hypothetical protein ASPGLDRAFT_31846 [Aspergillus glaucus CBS 516.65]OJJ88733.1 hypothetical protein ASPGLDRAFT_31846 [Aspergillus glaucus CBS 516.65]
MASYLQSPILNLHVANVKPGVTQRDFGHVWLGLIHYYFKLDDNLAGEEHVYETPEEHSNVLAVNSKDGKWRTHLSVLAKNFPDASQPANGALAMSGAVAIGDMVRFYELSLDEGELLPVHGDRVFHLRNDSEGIHEVFVRFCLWRPRETMFDHLPFRAW